MPPRSCEDDAVESLATLRGALERLPGRPLFLFAAATFLGAAALFIDGFGTTWSRISALACLVLAGLALELML